MLKKYPEKEWIVTVTGNFSYDTRTFNITYVSPTTIRISFAHFGASFSPYLGRPVLSSSKNGRTATFNASYNMMSNVTIGPVKDVADFGRYTHTITTGANQ